MPLRAVRIAVVVLCAGGIVGMIVASVAGNNNGWVVTFGLITAGSIVLLMAFSSSARVAAGSAAGTGPEEALAARLEERIQLLVETGADEGAVRDLVRDAVRLGRAR
jgi:dipeptide/tripeptide permease